MSSGRGGLSPRLVESARMKIRKLSKTGLADIHRLLGHNIAQLENSQQGEEAKAVAVFLDEAARRFFKLTPERVRPVSAE